jgi:hypothetical protein
LNVNLLRVQPDAPQVGAVVRAVTFRFQRGQQARSKIVKRSEVIGKHEVAE